MPSESYGPTRLDTGLRRYDDFTEATLSGKRDGADASPW